jgi:hypothetical protein
LTYEAYWTNLSRTSISKMCDDNIDIIFIIGSIPIDRSKFLHSIKIVENQIKEVKRFK